MSILVLIVLIAITSGRSVASGGERGGNEDEGGTDGNVRVDGDNGGGFEWNEVHGFVILENKEKMHEEFDITLCTEVKQRDGDDGFNWYASGHTFGELKDIHWNDDPEPSILIPPEELEEHASEEDERSTTVYILGRYVREGPSEDEVRKAYKKIVIQKPNHAPVAIAMITNSDENGNGMWDNWTIVDGSFTDEIVYYIDSVGVDVKFYLNASASTDEDGDEITEFLWDLDDNDKFGEESRERKMNTTTYLGEGDHLIGLMVGDGDKYSDPIDIRIVVKLPIRYPDLTIQSVDVVNKNGAPDFFKGDRCSIMAEVKNIGDVEIDGPFDIHFQYWYHEGDQNEPDWQDLGTERFTDTINVNGLKLIEHPWDTGGYQFFKGTYSFRAIADFTQEIKELREKNNEYTSKNITLEEEPIPPGDPILDFSSIEPSKSSEVKINEIVYINITLGNTGDGPATYVDIHYYINDEYLHFKTVNTLNATEQVTLDFTFAPDTYGTTKVQFQLFDNMEYQKSSDPVMISTVGPPEPKPPKPNETNETGPPIIYIAAGGTAAGIIGGAMAIFHFQKKKKEDMIW